MWESIGFVLWSLLMLGGGFIAGLIWVGDEPCNGNCLREDDESFS